MKEISLKNYIFYCYLIFGIGWYGINNYTFSPQVDEYIKLFLEWMDKDENLLTTVSICLCLPFELFVGRCMILLRNGKNFHVSFMFKQRIVDSK